MLEKLMEILKSLSRKKKSESENEEEIGSYSMNEGKPEKVFGVKRGLVKGTGITFFTIFLTAFVFAMSDEEEKDEEITPQVIADSEIARAERQDELPNDYASFVEMNRAKNGRTETEQKSPAKAETQTKPEAVNTQVTMPILPQNQYPQIETVQTAEKNLPTVPQIIMPPVEKEKVKEEKTKDGRFESSIAFSLTSQVQNKDEENTEEKSTKVSYKKISARTLSAGTIIPARLMSGINTDVSGQVTAQILSDVYDSARKKILIPQGSKILGTYERNQVTHGRVPIKFTQMILPDGNSVSMGENVVAVDGAGYTGIKGKIHHHTGEKLASGAMGSAIAALGSLAAGNTSSKETYSAGQLATQGAMANLINVTSKMFEQSSKIEDTVTVEPGYEFQVYITKDLEF